MPSRVGAPKPRAGGIVATIRGGYGPRSCCAAGSCRRPARQATGEAGQREVLLGLLEKEINRRRPLSQAGWSEREDLAHRRPWGCRHFQRFSGWARCRSSPTEELLAGSLRRFWVDGASISQAAYERRSSGGLRCILCVIARQRGLDQLAYALGEAERIEGLGNDADRAGFH